VTINPIFRFYFKEDINRHKGKLIGVPLAKMLLFINNKGEGLHEIGLCTSTRWSLGTWQLLLMFY